MGLIHLHYQHVLAPGTAGVDVKRSYGAMGVAPITSVWPPRGLSSRAAMMANCGPQCVSLLVMSWISLSMGAGDALKGPPYGSLSSVIV